MSNAAEANQVLSLPHVWRPSASVEPGRARTILLLHGTGADEFDLLSLGRALDPQANLLSPRGQVRAPQPPQGDGMIRWFMRNTDGTFDEPGIVAAVNQLAGFTVAAAQQYGFDLGNLWVAGFSNGANAAGALLLLHPELFRGVIAFGTTKSFVETPVKPDLSGRQVWICNGALDSYSPADKTDAMVDEFEVLGARVQLMLHGGGHTISHEHVREIAAQLVDLG